MMRQLVAGGVVLAALAGAGVAAGPAEAVGCTEPQLLTGTGLGIVQIRKAGVSCSTARAVARRATGSSLGRVGSRVRVSDRSWRCRVTQAATGTDAGSVSQTKVRCTSGRAVVRFRLAS